MHATNAISHAISHRVTIERDTTPQQGDRWHNDGDGRHDDCHHDNGKGQQGNRRHDDGDGQHNGGRHKDGKGQQGDRRHDKGDEWHADSNGYGKGQHGDRGSTTTAMGCLQRKGIRCIDVTNGISHLLHAMDATNVISHVMHAINAIHMR